jgi:hypothetical protein
MDRSRALPHQRRKGSRTEWVSHVPDTPRAGRRQAASRKESDIPTFQVSAICRLLLSFSCVPSTTTAQLRTAMVPTPHRNPPFPDISQFSRGRVPSYRSHRGVDPHVRTKSSMDYWLIFTLAAGLLSEPHHRDSNRGLATAVGTHVLSIRPCGV